MEKRLALALGLSMAILFVWWKIFPPPGPPQPIAPQAPGQAGAADPRAAAGGAPAVGAGAAGTSADGTAAVTGPGASGAGASGSGAAEGSAAPSVRGPEQRIVLDTADARFVLSSWGGTLREVRLKEAKFLERRGDAASGLQIVRTATPEASPLKVSFPGADFRVPDDAAWAVARPAATAVVFRTETAEVAVEKRYRLDTERFRLTLQVVVANRTQKTLQESLAIHLFGAQDPKKKGGGFLDYASANLAEMVCFVSDKAERDTVEALVSEPREKIGIARWIAADEKFFTLALAAAPETPAREHKCGRRALDPLTGEVFLSFSSRAIPAGGETAYDFVVFAGPKYASDLDKIAPGGQDARLGEVVDVSFAVLARPLLFLLKVFERTSGNWGVAIILLTLFVKIVTFYPTQKSMMSAKQMQRLAPKLQVIRQKYEKDRQRMGTETMNLYKAHGVSPFGGCLPALIQMPIWIALFSTLNYAVELHRSSFVWYIRDLSDKDPFYATPLLMGGVMFLQMRMSPAGADPQQQKMMAIMMPAMFTVFSLFLPAGLAIYTLTSYLLGILQQLYVNHLDRRASLPGKA